MGKIRFSPEGRQERDLLEDMGRRGLRRYKRQLQMIDEPIHNGISCNESDDIRRHPALGQIITTGFLGWIFFLLPNSFRKSRFTPT